jgi:hypothetical protein
MHIAAIGVTVNLLTKAGITVSFLARARAMQKNEIREYIPYIRARNIIIMHY